MEVEVASVGCEEGVRDALRELRLQCADATAGSGSSSPWSEARAEAMRSLGDFITWRCQFSTDRWWSRRDLLGVASGERSDAHAASLQTSSPVGRNGVRTNPAASALTALAIGEEEEGTARCSCFPVASPSDVRGGAITGGSPTIEHHLSRRSGPGRAAVPHVPSSAKEEAALALLVSLEEERRRVGAKGSGSDADDDAPPPVRAALVPLLVWNGHVRACVEVLSAAESASGRHEGSLTTIARWRALTFACLASGDADQAARIAETLLASAGACEEEHGAPNRLTCSFLLTAARAERAKHKAQVMVRAQKFSGTGDKDGATFPTSDGFAGGQALAVAAGWAEKAVDLAQRDKRFEGFLEPARVALGGCLLEAVTSGHHGAPACSPPRVIAEAALAEAATHLAAARGLSGKGKVRDARPVGSGNPIAVYLLALVLTHQTKIDAALDLLETFPFVTNSRSYVYRRALQSVLYAANQRVSKAVSTLLDLLEQIEDGTPMQAFVLRVLVRLCSAHKKTLEKERIEECIRLMVGRGSDAEGTAMARHASVLASELSLYYASEGKGKKALEKASRAVTLDPASGLAHHAMGMACECTGDNPGALQHYENAMAAVPQYGPSALAAATMWHAMDDRYAWHAKNLCRDALLWDPRNAEALLLLGKIEERMGNVDESKAHYLLGSRLAEGTTCIPPYEFPVIIWEDEDEW